MALRLAVVGDIHGHFGSADVRHLDGAGYDLVLFVGDLGGYSFRSCLEVAERISTLQTRALLINHDGVTAGQLLAEVASADSVAARLGRRMSQRVAKLQRVLGGCELAGYSRHEVARGGIDATLIAGRPHSLGGERIGFVNYLRRGFGVSDVNSSVAKLAALSEAAESERLVFFGHNGPTGLGDDRESIWGCDFRKEGGDFGDADLRTAVDRAKESRRVPLVIAGHMHRRTRMRTRRTQRVVRDGTLYINVAETPRVRRVGLRFLHHHVRVTLTSVGIDVEDVWLDRESGAQEPSPV